MLMFIGKQKPKNSKFIIRIITLPTDHITTYFNVYLITKVLQILAVIEKMFLFNFFTVFNFILHNIFNN